MLRMKCMRDDTGAVPATYFEGGHETKKEQGQNFLQISFFFLMEIERVHIIRNKTIIRDHLHQ